VVNAAKRIESPKEKSTLGSLRVVGQQQSPFEDVYHFVLTQSWARFFLLAVGLWLAINLVFAIGFLLDSGSIANARPGSLEDAFYFSVQTLGTIGYGVWAPATRWAHLLVTTEALVGTLFIALLTGVTFAKFARPSAKVLFARHLVTAPRNGAPHLMLRMANWRHNQMVDVQVRMYVLLSERTREGELMRRPAEVKLVRDTTPFFFLTFTAMHEIDQTSPFHADALEKLRQDGGEIFVSVLGYDLTFNQTVHAQHRYLLDDIAWNAHFHDVIQVEPGGLRIVDYTRFHDVVRIEGA
jgi:inward rectifier potassium channel